MSSFSVGRAGLVSLSGQWVKYLVQILTLVVFSRLLSAEDFGLVAMATAITGIAWVIGDFGLSLAALQADELSQDQKSMLFWANSGIGIALGIVLAAVAPLVALFYGDDRLVPVVIVIASTFVFNGIATQFKIEINRQFRFTALAGVDVISQVIGFGAGLAVILLGGTYWGIVASTVGMNLVAMVLFIAAARWFPGRMKRGVPMRALLGYGGDTFAVQVVTYIASNMDAIIIGRTRGADDLGLYNRAFQVASLPVKQIASPLTRVVLPALARRNGDDSAYLSFVSRIQACLNYGLLAVLSGLAAAAHPLIVSVLGAEWAPASVLLQILSLAAAFEAIGFIYYWVMLSKAKTRVLFWSELFPRIATVALMLAVASLGPAAIAGALGVGQALMWIVGAFYAMPKVGLPSWAMLAAGLRPLLVFGFAFGTSTALQALVHPTGVWLELLVAFAGWLLGFGLALLVPFVRRDLRALAGVLQGVRRR